MCNGLIVVGFKSIMMMIFTQILLLRVTTRTMSKYVTLIFIMELIKQLIHFQIIKQLIFLTKKYSIDKWFFLLKIFFYFFFVRRLTKKFYKWSYSKINNCILIYNVDCVRAECADQDQHNH
jgi:hypothetical protein